MMPKFLHSFNKHAKTYNANSLAQQDLALLLLKNLKQRAYAKVLDLGAGSGMVANILEKYGIQVDELIALDSAQNMLECHKKVSSKIQKITLELADFECYEFKAYDLIIACSSLQWALNLEKLLKDIALSAKEVALAIHTDFSLHEVHAFLKTTSPLKSAYTLKNMLKDIFKDFDFNTQTKRLVLHFKNKEDFFSHLQKSGLLGGGTLSFKQKKDFFKNMAFEKLSYEALLFWAIKRS
ncbi:methyltransferase domain-containing protein [Helicobacter cetorum]|uniref:methyltransferase domain-containing protein n=1 Tax=Helicobacter cetorum TaxID=138563 RepID=UPI000CF0A107|nr:methyltransferase domain-containing protein [Helicobacter cetorum]